MAMVNAVIIAAYRRIYWLRLIGLVQRLAATWRCVLHSSDELSQWHCHDDNTINIVVATTITGINRPKCYLFIMYVCQRNRVNSYYSPGNHTLLLLLLLSAWQRRTVLFSSEFFFLR